MAEVVIADLAAPPPDVAGRPRVRAVTGDLALAARDLGDADVIFHLAGVVSGAAEADFDLGMAVNVDGTRAVLEHARRQESPPVLVFSSSVAVFGADPAIGPLGLVGDDTLPRPQSSYGIQKFIAEQLVADYTRKGFIRGRSVRLMTVAVRPGKPNAAASSFVSGIIREPLAGLRAPCPVPAGHPDHARLAPPDPGRAAARRRRQRRGLGQPDGDEPARADHDAGGHGRQHGPGGRLPGERPHRLDRGPRRHRHRRAAGPPGSRHGARTRLACGPTTRSTTSSATTCGTSAASERRGKA